MPYSRLWSCPTGFTGMCLLPPGRVFPVPVQLCEHALLPSPFSHWQACLLGKNGYYLLVYSYFNYYKGLTSYICQHFSSSAILLPSVSEQSSLWSCRWWLIPVSLSPTHSRQISSFSLLKVIMEFTAVLWMVLEAKTL